MYLTWPSQNAIQYSCIHLLVLHKGPWNPTFSPTLVNIHILIFASLSYKMTSHSCFHLHLSDYNISEYLKKLISFWVFLSVDHLFISFAHFHWDFCFVLSDLQEFLVYFFIGFRHCKTSFPNLSAIVHFVHS